MSVLHLAFLLVVLLGTLAPGAVAQADVKGQWNTMNSTMTINPVHTALMHNGKILVIAGSGNCPPSQSGCPSGAPYGASNHSGATVFDPVAQTFNQLTLSWDMFCNGMTVLPDGQVFVNGGTIVYDPFHGQQKSSIFNPATNTFTDVPTSMAHGRWYPTVTLLSDGRVMTFSGQDETGTTNKTVEIYTVGSGWSAASTAPWTPPLYPRQHLLPNGNVFVSGPNPTTYIFNPNNQTWTTVATTKYGGTRTYGSSVLLPLTPANNYDPKVMLLGGSTSATATTEIIDLGAGSPSWVFGPDMSQARIEMDAVILPTGKVLALGGSSSDEVASTHSRNADLYDPGSNSFTSAGTNNFDRLYHSVALLLPDATVWSAGSNPSRGTWESHMEIYQPPYLFTRDGSNNVILATRPTIASAPANISWGGAFTVSTPDAANISQVVLVRPGSSTHAFDMDQRLVGMSFTAGSGSLTVTAPPNSKIAPPGYYMLFLINSNGVPSVAPFVLLNGSTSNPAPTVASITPNTGPAAGGTSVTITGTGFLPGATVNLGGTPATGVTVVSGTSITATAPAHAAGTVNVMVSNSDAQNGTLNNAYTYTGSGGGGGAISFVQVMAATPQTASASVAVTYTAAQTAGNLNVVAVGWNDTTSTVTGITDSRNNSYVLAIGPTTGTGLRQSIYYAKNIAAGANTVTVTFSKAAAFVDIRALEYSGLDTANPLDQTAGAAGSGTTASSGAATTTAANELIFGAGMTLASFTGAGSGFISRIITSPDADNAEDKTVSATGSYSATAPNSTSSWVMQMATFKASGQGGGNPAPTVTSIVPTSGTANGGTAITITGTGFLAGATVTVGGTAATNVNVAGSTSITATTPAHAAGAANVIVTNTDAQTGTLANGYTYTASNPAPTVTSISPTSGTTAGGTSVTITGTGFLTGATVSLGGTAATNVNVVSATSITATTPAHAAGAVSVVVTNTDTQTGSLNNGYTYTSSNPAPTVGSITPNAGPVAGGTAVTITGTGFLAGATVSLGGTAATAVNVVGSTSITATTPAHAAGAVTVTVTNSDAQSGSLTNGYTYRNPAPTVTSITPNTGTTAGGTSVTITGTGFTAGATVSLGGTAATAVNVVSSTSITATTPAHAAGAVSVVVTNSDAQSGTLTNGYTYTTSTGGGPITFVQVKSATPQTNSASVAVTYQVAQTLGNLNIVAVGWNDTTSTVTGVTDSQNNTYVLAIGPTTGTGLRQSIYYAKNIAAGSNTVTVTFSQAAAFVDIRALEYSGLDTANPLDQTAGAVGSGTTASSGAVTTTAANELIFGAGMTLATFTGAGTGFTSRIITSPDADIAEDRTVTTTGSYSATAPNSSSNWVMQVATFQKAP